MRVVVEGRISATRPVGSGVSTPGAIPARFPSVADGRSYVICDGYEGIVLPVPYRLQNRDGDRVRVTFEIEEEPRVPDPELPIRAEQG